MQYMYNCCIPICCDSSLYMLGAKLYEYEQALPSWVQIPNNSRTLSNQRLVSCYMPAMYFLLNIENFEMVE